MCCRSPGDSLFAYTDGVNEAKNVDGEQFTEERILEIENAADMSAGDLVRRVSGMIKSFRKEATQSDDITMIALKRQAPETGA